MNEYKLNTKSTEEDYRSAESTTPKIIIDTLSKAKALMPNRIYFEESKCH